MTVDASREGGYFSTAQFAGALRGGVGCGGVEM